MCRIPLATTCCRYAILLALCKGMSEFDDAKLLILIDLVNQARALDHVLAATILEAHASCR